MTERDSPVSVIIHPVSGECENAGLSKIELFATNAQNAIISNADTMREITNKVSGKRPEQQEAAFFKVVASIAVLHAKALVEALNE